MSDMRYMTDRRSATAWAECGDCGWEAEPAAGHQMPDRAPDCPECDDPTVPNAEDLR